MLAPPPSFAQANTAQFEAKEAEAVLLEEVIVTGTRIKRRDFNSPSPLTTISRENLEFSGQPTVEEYLNQMPQVQPDFGRTANNPGDGTARLNLRGLGAGRTLVLLNGRRLAPSGVGSAVDVNNLPRSILDRVEIITGGASAVYGSDAIAGVVNFITRQDYDGLSADASYSVTGKGDADIYDANVAYGHNLASGRGNVTAYAGYYERKPIFAADRKSTRVPYREDWDTGELVVGGSSFVPSGIVFFPRVDLGNGPERLTWNPDGTPRAFDPNHDRYNYAPVNYLQTPLTRYSAGLMANFDITDDVEAYLEAAFTRNQARQNLAPQPVFDFVLVNTDNPLLTPATRELFENQMLPIAPGLVGMVLGRRNLEMGPRILDFTRDYTRLLLGARGAMGEGWDFDAWVSYTEVDGTEQDLNFTDPSRFTQGLLVDPVSGACFDPSNGCVPLDVFGAGRLSPAGADFIRFLPLKTVRKRTQALASVVVTAAPFSTWAGPLDMAFGAEWRHDKGRMKADEILRAQGFVGGVDGVDSVWELYAEALVPLIDGAVGQHLSLELGARRSDYKNAGAVWTYKAGLEWQPTDSLRLRSMYQRAVRAPNLEELFTEQTRNLLPSGSFQVDPCSASADPVGSGNAQKCIDQGLPADQVGVFEATDGYPAYQTSGGNPALQPESSDTITLGVVLTPAAVPGLTLTVDYYDLEVTDTIGGINAMNICFDPNNTAAVFCDNIKRDQTNNIAELLELTSNRGQLSTNGVDTQVQYAHELPSALALLDGDARISINTIWTHIIANKTQENPVTKVLDCAGYFGWLCGNVLGGVVVPQDRVTANFDYVTGPLNIYLGWRWIAGTRNSGPLYSADFGFPDPQLAVPKVSAYHYFDLGFGYQFSDSLLLRLGVNNLFDKQPPQMADMTWSNNTDTGMYDVFGRAFFTSLHVEF